MKNGSLVVVGTGIKVAGDVTVRAQSHMIQADIVYYLVPDKISKQWLATLNTNSVDLSEYYGENKSRLITYNEMTAAIVSAVTKGKKVCAAFYGHPGVFVYPSHQAISQLRALGYNAIMEPGISAEDCLFADLGVDPAKTGCVTVEATQFILYERPFDPHMLTILWQIGLIGDHTLKLNQTNQYQAGLAVLQTLLLQYFSPNHQVIIYEAATLALLSPRIDYVPLRDLTEIKLTAISTLVIPPEKQSKLNMAVLQQLGITESDILESLSIEK